MDDRRGAEAPGLGIAAEHLTSAYPRGVWGKHKISFLNDKEQLNCQEPKTTETTRSSGGLGSAKCT